MAVLIAQTCHTIDDGAGQSEVGFAFENGDRFEAGNVSDIRPDFCYRQACRFIPGRIGKHMEWSLIGDSVCQQCLDSLPGMTGAVIDE